LEDANSDLKAGVREKTQETRRLAAQHAVTRILAEATTVDQAAAHVLTTLRDTLDCSFGALWQTDRYAPVLRCVAVCHGASPELERFAAQYRGMTYESGIGIPGKVWATRQEVIDLSETGYMTESGVYPLRGIAFPIIVGDAVSGVLELCDKQLPQPNDSEIQMLRVIAAQLGLFFERERLEEQVLHSQKMEAIGRLDGGIAHDFNNLLTSIVGYAHLIEKRLPEDSPLQRNALQIQKTGHRAAAMIQQLLAFSRRQVLKADILLVNEVFTFGQPSRTSSSGQHQGRVQLGRPFGSHFRRSDPVGAGHHELGGQRARRHAFGGGASLRNLQGGDGRTADA